MQSEGRGANGRHRAPTVGDQRLLRGAPPPALAPDTAENAIPAPSVTNRTPNLLGKVWEMEDLPEGTSDVFGSTEQARKKALQRSDLPDDMIDHDMSALREYAYSRAEATSGKTTSDMDDGAWSDPLEAAMADAYPVEMREVFDGAPAMPRTDDGFGPPITGHRDKMVPVQHMRGETNQRKRLATAAAQAAMKKEWGRVRAQNVWDESGVREWSHVAREATDAGTKAPG